MLEFKSGLKVVDSAQQKFSKLKKEVANYLKTLQTVESDILKANDALTLILIEDSTWEDTGNIKMKNGKKMIEKLNQKYKKSAEETAKMIQKLSETNSLITNEIEKGNRKEVSDELKIILSLLEIADENGKNSVKLIKIATTQGEKEASKYLKFAKINQINQPATTIIPSTTTTNTDSKSVKPESVKKESVKTESVKTESVKKDQSSVVKTEKPVAVKTEKVSVKK